MWQNKNRSASEADSKPKELKQERKCRVMDDMSDEGDGC